MLPCIADSCSPASCLLTMHALGWASRAASDAAGRDCHPSKHSRPLPGETLLAVAAAASQLLPA